MAGTLFVVATPIGNLGDMVPRAIEILQNVDLIAAEDTRRSGQLLRHFNIATELVSYHDHSATGRMDRLLAALEQGDDVALISDAGTPLISDPGYRLVRRALEQGCQLRTVPGACAAIAALSIAGLPSDRFAFEGFLPARSTQRKKALQALVSEPRTLIFYEAPHRILATVLDAGEIFGGEREAVVARELTKTYETVLSGSLNKLAAELGSDLNQQRGEIVLLVRGFDGVVLSDQAAQEERVLKVLLAELPTRQAAALAARITGGSKNELYRQALSLSQGG